MRTIDRRSARERGYNSRWDAASKRFRATYFACGMRPGGKTPVMSRCAEVGRVTKAEVTDHVIPHRGDEQLRWDESNWQALCRACHGLKTKAGL